MSTSLLLADDSPTIAKILGMALQAEAYEIRSVLTAEDAMRELKSKPPFFFLIDLTLPGTNGYEFAKLIRADSKLRQIRVLLLASAFDPVDDKLFAECGADAVIAKPFDPGELREKLRQIRDAPLKMPAGSNVQGTLSGHAFQGKAEKAPPPPIAMDEPPPLEIPDAGSADQLILSGSAGLSGDADSILSNLLGGEESPPAPPRHPLAPESSDLPDADVMREPTREFTNATVLLDLSGEAPPSAPLPEPVLDLSGSFTTPPGGTAILEFGEQPPAFSLPPAAAPPPSPVAAKPNPPVTKPAAPPATKPPAPPAAESLSANAQALAAFFEAEIDAKAPPPAPKAPPAPPAPEPQDDSFDASLSSIDWGGPKEENLNAWSSTPPAKPTAKPAPKPAQPAPTKAPAAPSQREEHSFSLREIEEPHFPPPAPSRSPAPPPATESRTHAGASSGGDFLFDTGGSNFRFSDDYIRRITKSFTGSSDEMILGRDPSSPQQHAGPFGQASHDGAPAAPSRGPISRESGGGAWSEEEVKRIEQLVREEVQMVVREVAEKVIWEVIPELAENLIRKELDKVLKEMDE